MNFLKICELNVDFKNDFFNHKVVLLKSKLTDFNEYTNFFIEAANEVGTCIIFDEDPSTSELILNQWNEIKYAPEKQNNAYKYSDKSQPLHTDYVNFSVQIFCSFFYCKKQAEFGGATVFVDVDTIVKVLKGVNPTLFEAIQKQMIHFGTSSNPFANKHDFILSKDVVGWRINWNYYRCQMDFDNLTLIEEFKSFLDHYIEKSGELTELKLEEGEGVFFHDTRVLHGRNSFVGERHLNKAGIVKTIPDELKLFLSKNK